MWILTGSLEAEDWAVIPSVEKVVKEAKRICGLFFFFLNSSLEDMLTDFREREGETEEGKHLV